MRVALLSPLAESVPPKLYGGTERVIHNLCRGLRAAGADVTLFATGDSTTPVDELVPVVPEAMRLSQGAMHEPHYYHFKMLAEVAERADEFDVIHNHHDAWMLPLSEMVRTPMLTTVHLRLDTHEAAEMFPRYGRARFVSISDSQRRPLPDLAWERTIHHGLDLDSLRFQPEPGRYLAFLGRMDPTKRPEWAIRMAKAAGIPLKLAAKIEGKAMREYYEAFVKPHVDGKFIEFIGEIAEHEKSEFLGNAYALAFPIDWPEPFGLVMVEALACGTPVLARPCGSVPEILKDGHTGFIHSDVDVLARKIHELPRISRFGCRRWAEKRFSIRRMTEDYLDVYRHLRNELDVRPASAAAEEPAGGAGRHRWDLVHSVQRLADGHR